MYTVSILHASISCQSGRFLFFTVCTIISGPLSIHDSVWHIKQFISHSTPVQPQGIFLPSKFNFWRRKHSLLENRTATTKKYVVAIWRCQNIDKWHHFECRVAMFLRGNVAADFRQRLSCQCCVCLFESSERDREAVENSSIHRTPPVVLLLTYIRRIYA